MEWMLEHSMLMLLIAGAFGFLMAWGVGANDVANAMGTSVGAGALTVKQAVLIAIIFEFAGAYLAGGEVTATVRKGIVDAGVFSETPHYLIYGMLAALLAAGIWLVVASWAGWPVSTTHSIVGAIVGFAAVGVGMDSVHWDKVGSIVASWVTSPLLAGFISFFLIKSVQRLVLNQDDPFQRAKKRLARIHMDERDIVVIAEKPDDLLALIEAHQAVVDIDAGQLVTDGLMDQHGGDRRVHAP